MDIQQAQGEFRIASSEFEAELEKSAEAIAKSLKQIDDQQSIWSRLRTMSTAVLEMMAPNTAKLTIRAALEAVVKAHKIIDRLADATDDPGQLTRYTRAMRGLTAEYTALAERVLDQSATQYKPLTQTFIGAAGELKNAYQKATQLASNLNLAADLINAFAKLVSVF